uniref:Uncharacterized protein n=1 Tax=Rhizophora mucronata TaxID=61149 RepID=A0A2P2NBM2_RHIMU
MSQYDKEMPTYCKALFLPLLCL